MKITHPRRNITNQRPCPARPRRQWSWPGRLTHLPIAGGVGVEQCVPQTGRRISAISRPEQGTKCSSLIQSLRHRRRRLKQQSPNLPRPPRPRAPEKSLNYLSEISDAEQSLEPQPQASPPPVAQTNVVPVLDGAEIRTGQRVHIGHLLQLQLQFQPSCQNFRDRLPRGTIHCQWSRTGSTCWNISTGRASSNLQTCEIIKY